MHADLMLLCLLYLRIMVSTKTKSKSWWAKSLSISLLSSRRDHLGLAKYHIVWVTISRYFLLDALTLACAIWIVIAYIIHHGCSYQTINHLNSLIMERSGLCLQNAPIFPEQPFF